MGLCQTLRLLMLSRKQENIIPTMAQEALDNVQAEIAKTEAIINS